MYKQKQYFDLKWKNNNSEKDVKSTITCTCKRTSFKKKNAKN